MSLGLRLLLLNGLVLVLVLGAFASVSYVSQERALQEALDTSLREQASVMRANMGPGLLRLRGRTGPFGFDGAPFGRPGNSSNGDPLAGSPRLAASDVFIQVTMRDGTVLARSRNLDDRSLPIPAGLLARVADGEDAFLDVEVEDEPLRMFLTRVTLGPPVGGTTTAVLQTARPRGPMLASLETLRATFVTLGVVGVLVSLVLGGLLARVALRPINRLAAAAQAIGRARDFGRRVPAPGGKRRDEIGRLADELNDMLAHLQDAYAQLEAALAAQRRFVADASHELRTPLTSLRGNVALLQRAAALGEARLTPDDEEQLLADMAAETERLTRLVADLLLLAQADAGQHLTRTPVEIATIIRDAFRAARFLKPGVALQLGEVPTGAWVDGDADRLKQLLLILLDNGLKYTPSGGEVAIGATMETRDGQGGIAIAVQDTGAGIPQAEQAHLFERFYRSDRARTSDGAGLGLAIARWITDEHHGAITVHSTVGEGSQFTVWLPAGAGPSSVTRTRPAPAGSRAPHTGAALAQ